MRTQDRKALNAYCRDLADQMGLRDWTITVAVEEPTSPDRVDDATWCATSNSTPGRKVADLTFSPTIRDWKPEDVRNTVVHELVHPHFDPLFEMVREDLHTHVSQSTYDVFCDGARRWLEYGVDAMAEIIAPSLPLIAWP